MDQLITVQSDTATAVRAAFHRYFYGFRYAG